MKPLPVKSDCWCSSMATPEAILYGPKKIPNTLLVRGCMGLPFPHSAIQRPSLVRDYQFVAVVAGNPLSACNRRNYYLPVVVRIVNNEEVLRPRSVKAS